MATIQIESATTPLAQDLDHSSSSPPQRRHNKHRRSCLQWWRILPPPYKFFLIIIGLVVLLVSYLYLEKVLNLLKGPSESKNGERKFVPNPEYALPPSSSHLHLFKGGAVCSDSEHCSKIGSDILNDDGHIVDAAIATLFCNGIATIQSMGIGGGFVMNLYIHDERKAHTLNVKEVAPLAATEGMFKSQDEYLVGPLTIAVPGEVKGYWELHQKYGKKKWASLVEPTIKLCEEGVQMTKHMRDSILPHLLKDSQLKDMLFINGTETPRHLGDLVKPPAALCNTLKMIAEKGDDFYNGTLADLIVDDLRDIGSIVTKKDLELYKSRWEDALAMPLNDDTVYVTSGPTGGPFVASILNVLSGYNLTAKSIETDDEYLRTIHRFIESSKYAFGYRTQLTDSASGNELIKRILSPELADQIRKEIDDSRTYDDPKHYGGQYDIVSDKGTSHVSILAPNGDAISVTSSINNYFGSGNVGKRTGIIFNNGMNDFGVKNLKNQFGLPASSANYIVPQKRPTSSVSPTIVTDKDGDVRLVVGAAGGTKIITSTASVIARQLWLGEDIKQAVDAPRIHHQLMPMLVEYEYGNTQKLITGLELLGHKTERYTYRGSVVCAIAKNQTGIYANADYRKEGEVVGL